MTTLTVYEELEQGTEEWLLARCGILTASTLKHHITPSTVKPANNDTSRAELNKLATERIRGYADYVHPTWDMQRGTEDEPLARSLYAELRGPVREVGFMVREGDGWKVGYSPDGLIGDDGLLEIKCPQPKEHLRTILAGQPPAQYMAQLQAGLFVSGRAWIDYMSYSAGMRPWITRVGPDERWFKAIRETAVAFEVNVTNIINNYEAVTAGMPETEAHEPEIL